MPARLPSAPSGGPLATWPRALAWLLIDRGVARVSGSRLRLSQAERTGAATASGCPVEHHEQNVMPGSRHEGLSCWPNPYSDTSGRRRRRHRSWLGCPRRSARRSVPGGWPRRDGTRHDP